MAKFIKKHARIIHVISICFYLLLVLAYTILSLQNGEKSSNTSSSVAHAVADAQETITGKNVIVTQKYELNVRKIVGHYGFFLLIGLFSAFSYMMSPLKKNISAIIHFLTGLFFALITEFWFQASSQGRSPALKDVIIDYSGFLTFSVLIVTAFIITQKKKC